MAETSFLTGGAADFEDAIRRFEVAWQGPAAPEIGAFLTPGAAGYARLLVELVHVDLEYRLRAGQAARVEDYLAKFPALADDRDTMLGLLAAEYEWRRRRESELAVAERRAAVSGVRRGPAGPDRCGDGGLRSPPARARRHAPARRRRLRGRGAARPRRHGGRIHGPANPARPARRLEVPARGVCSGSRVAGSVPPGSTDRLGSEPPEHLHYLRYRPLLRPAVYCHGAG